MMYTGTNSTLGPLNVIYLQMSFYSLDGAILYFIVRSLELRYDDTSFGNFRVFKGCMKEQYADFTFGLERILEFDALDEI